LPFGSRAEILIFTMPKGKGSALRALRSLCDVAMQRAAAAHAGVALLAAPTFVGCSPPPDTADGDATVTIPVTTTDPSAQPTTTGTIARTNTPATALPGDCKVSPPDITGCGGAEVEVLSSLGACSLPEKGDLAMERCASLCGTFETRSCRMYTRSKDKKVGVFCDAAKPCLGRQPARRLRASATRTAGDPVAAYLRYAAKMEHASVEAFSELERELAAHGAPLQLRRACRRAADDEARHATAMQALLRARGARRSTLAAKDGRGFSSLLALAIHNETEGVVGETWGAVLARHQSEHAADPSVRGAMRTIWKEELQHAALSLRISTWVKRKLPPADRAKVERARTRALSRLQRRAARMRFPGEDAERTLGWPTAEAHTAIVAAIAELRE
jgi:hypothetical protein